MQIEISSKGYFTNINQFKLVKDIGVGSFGKVKLAIHRGTRKQYAIKIIQIGAHLAQTDLQLIIRQIKLHSKLDHPHIIKLWDTFVDNNKIYMVMDYAKNGSLFRYHTMILQTKTQLSQIQKYQFFYQTLQAIKYLHSNDIMHRDIKPENLLLDQDYNIKLCDFGWATCQINNLRSTFCGTYEYMAPEMVLEKSYDYRIDIWALGVLLYQLLQGKAPFQAETFKIMKQKINKGSYEIDTHCEAYLKQLIVGILQFIPEKRFSIKDIENHIWVKQNLLTNIQNLIPNNSQVNKTSFVFSNAKRKHQYQKSTGDYITQGTNYLLLNKNQGHFESKINNYLGNEAYKVQISKKHKRNITQHNNFDHLLQENQIKNLKSGQDKKNSMLYDSIKLGQTALLMQESIKYHPDGKQKYKMKCKTQAEQQLNKLQVLPFLNIGSKRNLEQSDEESQLKKKKHNILIESTSSSNGNLKNANNGQPKQNQIQKQKARKRHKQQQKVNPKVKKIQQKLSQISTKFANKKAKQNQLIY